MNPEGLANAGLKDTTVTLPAGVVVNPGQANGLAACQTDEEALGSAENGEVNEAPPSCPAASKIGTDEITTPLLPDKLKGNVYILQSNPPELKMLVAASGDGVNLKLLGTAHFERDGPGHDDVRKHARCAVHGIQLVVQRWRASRARDTTTCGLYVQRVFAPWSAPFVAEAFLDELPDHRRHWRLGVPRDVAVHPDVDGWCDDRPGRRVYGLLDAVERGDGQQRIDGLSSRPRRV